MTVLSDDELFALDVATEAIVTPPELSPALGDVPAPVENPVENMEADDLADLLAELGERAPRFAVVDEGSAGWVVDKLLSYDERIARITEQFLAMTAGLKADKARFERRFLPELEAYYDRVPKKGKSLKLLTGTLSKRSVTGAPKIVDEKAVLEWAETDLPKALVPVPATVKLDGDAVRKHCKATGEVVPGVEWTPDREVFDVKGPKPVKKDEE